MDKSKSTHREHREARIENDKCPECNGELDTGWECNACGFNAKPEALKTPKSDLKRRPHEP